MKTIFLVVFSFLISSLNGQERYYTQTGYINFFSSAPLEDISADNNQVAGFLTIGTGEVTFAALIKSFEFEKALMQEHFNENYLESHIYPRASFKGIIDGFNFPFTESEVTLPVNGELTIHGVTKPLITEVTLRMSGNNIKGNSKFIVKPVDFNIKIPAATRDNIAKRIEVTVDVLLKPYN